MRKLNQLLADPRFCFIGLVSLGLSMGITPFVAGAYLEAATRTQCSTQDWPAEMHASLMEFCKEYGYSTNSN